MLDFEGNFPALFNTLFPMDQMPIYSIYAAMHTTAIDKYYMMSGYLST